jgi:hypothetical protein
VLQGSLTGDTIAEADLYAQPKAAKANANNAPRP